MTTDRPAATYLQLWHSGELERRAAAAHARLQACDLCPWQCGVNRLDTAQGAVCRSGRQAVVAHVAPSYGEEAVLTGRHGSGTIFFAGCNLRCTFCHIPDISQHGRGCAVSAEELAAQLLHLQTLGCANINLVTPTHVIPHILAALLIAAPQGLCLPLIYNTSAYDRVEVLRDLLNGVIDIYLPDLKFADEAVARRWTSAPDYVAVSRAAVQEMARQVGELRLDARGLAWRGVLIRHLVLPQHLPDTFHVLDYIDRSLPAIRRISLMRYWPPAALGLAPPLDRPLPEKDYQRALAWRTDRLRL